MPANLTPSQYKQIALAIFDLPESDQKANLVQVITNNFVVADLTFKPFDFVKACYVVTFPEVQLGTKYPL